MVLEIQPRSIPPVLAPLPTHDAQSFLPVDATASWELSLLTGGGDDPRLNVTGYDNNLDMIVLSPENFVATANGQGANLGDAVNEWARYDLRGNSFKLDTQTELDACAADIKNYDSNRKALEAGTDRLLSLVIVPPGVCYDGINGVGADSDAQIVQATAQAVYSGLQKKEAADETKKGIVIGVSSVVAALVALRLAVVVHKTIKRAGLGYGPPVVKDYSQVALARTPVDDGEITFINNMKELVFKLSELNQLFSKDKILMDIDAGKIFIHDGLNQNSMPINPVLVGEASTDLLKKFAEKPLPQTNPLKKEKELENEPA